MNFNRKAWIACLRNDISVIDMNQPIGQYDVESKRWERITKVLNLIKSKSWRTSNPWFFAEMPLSIPEVEILRRKAFERVAASRVKLRQYNQEVHWNWKRLEELKKRSSIT